MTPTKSQQAQEYAKKKFPELLLTIEKEPWPKTREILAKAYSDGYTAAEQSMWRSVGEELPPINEVVIASYIGFTFAYYDGTDWWAIDGDYIKPTKFMYIPSLPDTNTEKI